MVFSTWMVALLVATAVPFCQGQGQDVTVVSGASSAPVVNAVVDRIRSRCVFSEDRLFLRRVAYIMSDNGLNSSTYRPGYDGGIWQVNETMFNETRDCDDQYIQAACNNISTELGIDWPTVTWSDLRKPLYSGLAAALSTLLTLKNESMPGSIDEQANVWAEIYGGDPETFISEATNATDLECGEKLDLAFILDSSGSISDEDFSLITSFAADVVNVMDVSPDLVRVADIVYATIVTVHFDFDDYSTKEDVRSALKNTFKLNSGTMTNVGLNQAAITLYDYAGSGARPDAKKVAVVVTDGQSEDPAATVAAAKALKDLGTTVFVIGVGDFDMDELAAIASDPTCSHVLTLTSFDQIQSILTEIQQSTCAASTQLTEIRPIEGTLTGTYTELTAQTRVPDRNKTIEATVSCGILDIYVSTNDQRPNPEVYDAYYQATPTVPAILNITDSLPVGTLLYVTVIGTKLSEAASNLTNCTDYRWTLGVVDKTEPETFTTQGPFEICEDAQIDCAAEDEERQICMDPGDAAQFCPRYCGLCQGPTEATDCRDFDRQCYALIGSTYCAEEIAMKLCARSCDLCGQMTEQPFNVTTTTTEAPTTTIAEPETNTTMAEIEVNTTMTVPETTETTETTEIIDPNCQDVDPDCINLLQKHYCDEETVVRKLCQRSCNLCPIIQVPVEGETNGTVTIGPGEECQDKDPECEKLVESFYCGTNELIRNLCPSTCDICPHPVTGPTESPDVCTDYDPLCPEYVEDCHKADLLIGRLCRQTCDLCGLNITIPIKDRLPLTCRVCVDPFCELEAEEVVKCPTELPYCATRIVNNADGTHGVTKSCVSKDTCDTTWYAGLAAGNETQCANYDPDEIIQEPFVCSFCCTMNQCNRHAKPDVDTLYMGVFRNTSDSFQ